MTWKHKLINILINELTNKNEAGHPSMTKTVGCAAL